jgi:TonB family protein
VVKVMRPAHSGQAGPAGSEAVERFLREARVAIRLRHPNLAVLHDFAVGEDSSAFMVLELIAGWSLLEILQDYGPPPLPLSLEVARQTIRALGYLHRNNIIHRDVSPDNLMLTRDVDGQPLVKLIDLGIAKEPGEDSVAGLTAPGAFLGKPRYAAPEQFRGQGTSPRSDLYSFGIVLCELLTGRCPISGHDAPSYMVGHLSEPPLGFDELDPFGEIPEELCDLITSLLQKQPEERLGDAGEVARVLARLQERYPYSPRDLAVVLDGLQPHPTSFHTEPPARPGWTQERLDRQFALERAPFSRLPLDPVTPSEEVRVAALRRSAITLVRTPPMPPTPRTPSRSGGVTPSSWALREILSSELPLPSPQAERSGLLVGLIAASLVLVVISFWGRPAFRARGGVAAELTRSAAPGTVPVREVAPEMSVTTAPEIFPGLFFELSPDLAPYPLSSLSPADRRAISEAPLPSAPMRPGALIRQTDQGRITPPFPLDLGEYPYPEKARGSGRKVGVRVALLVDETGRVIDAQLCNADKSGFGFNEIAFEAARKVRFQPASREGLPGMMWTEMTLHFEE